jgi:hypothetical protein
MPKEKTSRPYICSSANWECLVEGAFSPNEAAAIALHKQVKNEFDVFSVGATILVTPITLHKKESEYIYSPSVLADIGMYKYADDLSRNLEKNFSPPSGEADNEEKNDES